MSLPIATADLFDRYWQAILAYHPIYASTMGDDRFDKEIDDLSLTAGLKRIAQLKEFLRDAREIPRALVDRTLANSLDVLQQLVCQEIQYLEQDPNEFLIHPLSGAHAALLRSASEISVGSLSRLSDLTLRYRRSRDYLSQASTNLQNGVGRGRSASAACIHLSIRQIDEYLATPIKVDPFASPLLKDGNNEVGVCAARTELRRVTEQEVRPAFQSFRTALSELLESTRRDHHCGLAWMVGGQSAYESIFYNHCSTSLTPDECHRSALDHLSQEIVPEIARLSPGISSASRSLPVLESIRAMRRKDVLSASTLLEIAKSAYCRASDRAKSAFHALPSAPCEFRVVPQHLRDGMPPAFYSPMGITDSCPAVFYLNTKTPPYLSRNEIEAVTFHETVPGHHLQISLSAERQDLPTFRRRANFMSYVEGWAMYAELLAMELDLYTDNQAILGMYCLRAVRAVRATVDTGIHWLGWSRDHAIRTYRENTALSEAAINEEVDRCIGVPGQGSSYWVGYKTIVSLRDRARRLLGQHFSITDFHRTILMEGALTCPLLEKSINGWIGATLSRSGGDTR